jgi:MFS family permease
LYIPYEVASLEAVMHGLYLLWWVQERHISPPIVATILAAGDLAITVFEIPTGWFADRFGYRLSLIVGSFIQVAGILCCWLGQGISGLLAASLLVALGDGFRSGADQALLYRSCAVLGREPDFQKLEATARTIQLAAMVGLVLAGGAVVEAWGFGAGWLVETALCAVGLIIACAMAEPPAPADVAGPDISDSRKTEPGLAGRTYLWALLSLTAPAALLSGAATATGFWAQTAGESDPGRMTALVAAITLSEAAGSMVAARLPVLAVRVQLILAGLGIAGVAAVLARPSALVPCAIGLSLLLGLAQPLRAAAIQRLASDGVRARAASIASACDKMCDTVALALAGFSPRGRKPGPARQ